MYVGEEEPIFFVSNIRGYIIGDMPSERDLSGRGLLVCV